MPVQCLIFDCDGVILDSVPAKTRAFARLAEPYGTQAMDRLVVYHIAHGGVNRYKKFEWFFREVLGRAITPEESAEWGRLFVRYALDEVRSCRLIAGAQKVLDDWRGRLPLFVCSGAPQEELRVILRERRLENYFGGIYGSPPDKAQLLTKIVAETALPPDSVLMVGDAVTDRDAAEYAGTRFYGVGVQIKSGDFPWSLDLTELNDWIAENIDG
ncbi:MAG: HAD hydrolase-like protein [Desulfovibrio sp.]|jgi:phosphoglycolate phosphatase-like HAD superfamily hydrolase|nr:HAD hydrolase-like protein [Desulfovibrio sp.]